MLSGLREEFCNLRACQAIKNVLHRCVPCKMAKAHHVHQIKAQLPADPVITHKTFVVRGIDLSGSMLIKVGSNMWKGCIDLFTCSPSRAVHLVLCIVMSIENFLLTLQQFVGRRRQPENRLHGERSELSCHQQTTCSTMDLSICSQKSPITLSSHNSLQIFAPRAAWWGGWWERAIVKTKLCLRKVLGWLKFSEEWLNTILVATKKPITQDQLCRPKMRQGH